MHQIITLVERVSADDAVFLKSAMVWLSCAATSVEPVGIKCRPKTWYETQPTYLTLHSIRLQMCESLPTPSFYWLVRLFISRDRRVRLDESKEMSKYIFISVNKKQTCSHLTYLFSPVISCRPPRTIRLLFLRLRGQNGRRAAQGSRSSRTQIPPAKRRSN